MAGRTIGDIISDFELWAQDRLICGEETIYLPARTQQDEITIHHELKKTTLAITPTIKTVPVKALMSKSSVSLEQTDQWKDVTNIPMLRSMIAGCTKCDLHKTRTNLVFGVGNPHAKVMVIGEAPGADEDASGEPFVGRAGQLLTKMLLAINFPREEVFIANILKSRPPGNRDPKPEEIAACEPYLWKQIELIKPKLILCAGRVAGSNLLKLETDTLGKMRGKFYDFMGAKVMVTYHPAALLRNPAWKVGAWEDLQMFRKLYDEMESSVVATA